jgi:hypothetical protein
MGDWRYSSTIPNLAVDGIKRTLFLWVEPSECPFDERFSGLQGPCGRCVEEKNPLRLPGTEPRFVGRTVPRLVPILSGLLQLPSPVCRVQVNIVTFDMCTDCTGSS